MEEQEEISHRWTQINPDRRKGRRNRHKVPGFDLCLSVFICGCISSVLKSVLMAPTFNTDILHGKVAFVTGGGTGITGGVARAFAAHGAKLAITSRKEDNLIPQKQFVEENGGECLAVAADVREFDAVENAIKQTLDHYGRIDIVINGAAGNFLCAANELSANGFGTVVDIDTKGTFNVCRASFEALKESRGQIINISATLHYLDAHADTRLCGEGRR